LVLRRHGADGLEAVELRGLATKLRQSDRRLTPGGCARVSDCILASGMASYRRSGLRPTPSDPLCRPNMQATGFMFDGRIAHALEFLRPHRAGHAAHA